ncbi:MAG: hypothetical protein ACRC92_20225 [Peptostreptococcaceae bacterium]
MNFEERIGIKERRQRFIQVLLIGCLTFTLIFSMLSLYFVHKSLSINTYKQYETVSVNSESIEEVMLKFYEENRLLRNMLKLNDDINAYGYVTFMDTDVKNVVIAEYTVVAQGEHPELLFNYLTKRYRKINND